MKLKDINFEVKKWKTIVSREKATFYLIFSHKDNSIKIHLTELDQVAIIKREYFEGKSQKTIEILHSLLIAQELLLLSDIVKHYDLIRKRYNLLVKHALLNN